MTKETNEVERDELLERLRRVAHGSPSDWAMYATPVDYLDAVARIERVTRERDEERRLADLRGERLSKVEAALADALARLEEAEGRGSDA